MKDLSKKVYKILILNSDPIILKLIGRAVSKINFKYKVIYTSSTSEAKKHLLNNQDIALTLICSSESKVLDELDLVYYIRRELNNEMMSINIYGTQKSSVDIDAISYYDITYFGGVAKLSDREIFSTLRSSLTLYRQLLQLEYKEKETYKKMTTDSLTHLYNRVKLNEECSRERVKTLILIDIVGFSKINENYGYLTGDSVLKEFAAFLYTMYHDEFNVYHLENDLFALIPILNIADKIFTTVENIRADILQLNIITDNFNKTVDISIGVAYESKKNLLRRAELALKEARNYGVNKIKYYSEDLKVLKQINDTNHWAPIIRESIINSTMIVHYQPIYNLQDSTIDKYELLMRISHGDKLYYPGSFLDAAFQAGQMYDIFKYMFKDACVQAKKSGAKFSVNIGNFEFEEESIVSFIRDTINEYELDATLISLEILEYNSISSNKLVKNNIIKIHELGIEIVIDDFGVNCSNFGQLQNLPIDIIKIDGSFIENIDSSKESQIIVKTIKTYAKEKNIKLVAEYILSEKVLETVKNLGIDYGQGNFLGYPLATIKEV